MVVEVLVMLTLTLTVQDNGQVGQHQLQVKLVHLVDMVVEDQDWLVQSHMVRELLVGN